MNRNFVYPSSIPLDTDVLNPQQQTLIALGFLMQAAIGTGTYVDGLAGTQTTVPSMTINIGPGSIISLQEVDPNPFGSLAANTNPLVKMGINLLSTQFTLTAPATSGQSINYLIEAEFVETDGAPVVLPYVNPSNPAVPYSGPSNSGTAQNTIRAETVGLQLKAGAAATTGTQTTPATDSGWVPLYVITVNYGQTAITTSQIVQASGAPFLAYKVPQINPGLFATIVTKNTAYTVQPTDNGTMFVLAGSNLTFPATSGIAAGFRFGVTNGSGTPTITVTGTVVMPGGNVTTTIPMPNVSDFGLFEWDGAYWRLIGGSADLLGAAQLAKFSVTIGSNYYIIKRPDPTTPSGYTIEMGGVTANFSSESSQTVTYPTTLNGVLPGGYGATTLLITGNNTSDQIAQVVETPGVSSMVVYMQQVGGGSFTWPIAATWWVKGY